MKSKSYRVKETKQSKPKDAQLVWQTNTRICLAIDGNWQRGQGTIFTFDRATSKQVVGEGEAYFFCIS